MTPAQPDITIDLPIYVRLGKKPADRFSLNLNIYRNAHFYTLSKAKLKFEELVAPRLVSLPAIAKVELTYSLFFGSRRAIDISNICCVVDKFFCDTLVNQKKLVDDNMGSISIVTYQWGGVDLKNPRVEVTLSNIQTVEEPMQIILTQQEIEEAIRDTVLQQIAIREDQGISITFGGISTNHFQATITIQKVGDEEAAPKKVRTRKVAPVGEFVDEPTQPEPAKTQVVERAAEMEQPGSGPSGLYVPEPGPVAPRIFPDANTSAPATAVDNGAGTSVPPGKSLFGNLTRPVHDPAPE